MTLDAAEKEAQQIVKSSGEQYAIYRMPAWNANVYAVRSKLCGWPDNAQIFAVYKPKNNERKERLLF